MHYHDYADVWSKGLQLHAQAQACSTSKTDASLEEFYTDASSG